MAVALSFGTAGIRAPMGDEDHQLNTRTVRAVADAVTSYLLEAVPAAREQGLCVAFDGRSQSEDFARTFSEVALARGFLLRRFEMPVPTPLLAFCTRRHSAAAGIMITASHNPPSDNGIKIYWQGGAQILAPHDRAIAQRLAASDAAQVPLRPLGSHPEQEQPLGEPDVEAYLAAVVGLIPASTASLPRIAYTALHGVGSAVTRRLLARLAVSDVVEVAAQAEPHPHLGGLASPNPEHAEALSELLALALREHAALAFAHDPDADRLAVAVRTRAGSMRVLTGDEVGALLGDFMLEQCPLPGERLVVSTLVSSALLGDIARGHGARHECTLTGFKWIASRARTLEREQGVTFVYGYEEAIGYAFGQLGDDKDGLAALRVLLELAGRLHAQGRTLEDALETLHRRHGLYATRQLTLQGDAARMTELIARARSLSGEALLGAGASTVDYLARPEQADLLVMRKPDGTRLAVRPSGTEPKLKLYLEVREPVNAQEPLAAASARAQSRLEQLSRHLGQLFA